MKRILSLFMVLVLLTLVLCSCGKEKAALVISGTEISEEVYNYYHDLVSQRPGDYDLGEKPGDDAVKDATVEQCRRYIAVNTYFSQLGLSLTVSEKVTVSTNVNNYWLRSQKHYENIGVSKQTLTKVFTADEYEDAIFDFLYDKGTDNTEGEKQITSYFYSNYVAFRNVCVYYTKEQEKVDTENAFNTIAVNSDSSESFTSNCSDAGYTVSDIIILDRQSDGYPAGFFDTVYGMTPGYIRVIQGDGCLFLVEKENLEELGDSVYANYRSLCIENMYASQWQQTMDSYIAGFTIDEVNV